MPEIAAPAVSVKAPASLVTAPVDVPVMSTVAPGMGAPVCRSTTVPRRDVWAARAAGMTNISRADTNLCMRQFLDRRRQVASVVHAESGDPARETALQMRTRKMDTMEAVSMPVPLRTGRDEC